MKRFPLVVLAAAAIGAVLFVALRRPAAAPQPSATAKQDSLWYHESDVAMLATTGRPQLLEFFHPT